MNSLRRSAITDILCAPFTGYEYNNTASGNIKLYIVWRGEGLFFQLNDKALICDISARYDLLLKSSINEWHTGEKISPEERDELLSIIVDYYEQGYKGVLKII